MEYAANIYGYKKYISGMQLRDIIKKHTELNDL